MKPAQHVTISDHYWLRKQQSAAYASWAGYAFEALCFKHIKQIIKQLGLTVVVESASQWRYLPPKASTEVGAQIDMILDRADRCINLVELKFYNTEFIVTKDIAKKLNDRRELFRRHIKTKKTIFNTLITSHGAAHNAAYLSAVDQDLTMDALFDE